MKSGLAYRIRRLGLLAAMDLLLILGISSIASATAIFSVAVESLEIANASVAVPLYLKNTGDEPIDFSTGKSSLVWDVNALNDATTGFTIGLRKNFAFVDSQLDGLVLSPDDEIRLVLANFGTSSSWPIGSIGKLIFDVTLLFEGGSIGTYFDPPHFDIRPISTYTKIASGFSETKSEYISARLVSVVPEPTTLALIGFGLAGLGFARRRRTH